MPRSPAFQRIVHRFAHALEQQIQTYALTASAAGVGVIALAFPAEARIIYTPANLPINGYVAVDLNQDGITDLALNTHYAADCSTNTCTDLQVLYASFGVVWGSGGSASALPTRVLIGNNERKFGPGYRSMAQWEARCQCGICVTDSGGNWRNVTDRYLGVRFSISGQTHYGWARLTVNIDHGISATLTGYAYETIANKPILIGNGDLQPEETTLNPTEHSLGAHTQGLGSLALGAQGRAFGKTTKPVGNR
jgi:hypothetical protein